LKISATSKRSNLMPHSCAIAGRCSAALVEPPEAATTVAAFSSALRVTMSRGRMFWRMSSTTISPAVMQNGRGLVGRRAPGRIRQREADRLRHGRHGVGGELRPAGAGGGAGDLLELVEVLVRHGADRVLADRLEQSCTVTGLPRKLPGRIEPP
jgi:hypothetical protein